MSTSHQNSHSSEANGSENSDETVSRNIDEEEGDDEQWVEGDDEQWVKDFRQSRAMLNDLISDDMQRSDEEWGPQGKEKRYKPQLEKCLKLETCRKPLPPPVKDDEALSILQFIIDKFYKLYNMNMYKHLNLNMANRLVGLVIELENKKGSAHLLSMLRATSDTKATPKEVKSSDADQWDEKANPLFMAIQFDKKVGEGSPGLTVFICKTLTEADRKEALESKNEDNVSWLHAALLANVKGVKEMIQWAPETVLCEGRNATGSEDGNTPLHDALNYEKHIAPFPKCLGTQWVFKPESQMGFAPELENSKPPTAPPKSPCAFCITAAKNFQNSWEHWDGIVNQLLKRDIQALRKHNVSGRSPYLYYLHTREKYFKEKRGEESGSRNPKMQLPTARNDSADMRKGTQPKAKNLNPKTTEDVDAVKKDNEHNKKPDDSKTFDREQKAGSDAITAKRLPDNSKSSDESKSSDNPKSNPKTDSQPRKKAVQFADTSSRLTGESVGKHEGEPAVDAKPIRRNSQVFGAESSRPNMGKRRPSARTSKPKSTSHRESDLQKKELTVGLDKKLKEKAYELGGYDEAFECLFRKQRDDHDMGPDEEHRLQSWSLEDKEVRISKDTTKDFNFFSFEPMLSSLKIDLHDIASEQELEKLSDEGKISRWVSMQNNFVRVFHWLKNKKGVKGIVSLVVRDRGPIFCSDKTMQECLKGLEIRYLDWDRPDICTDTLRLTKNLVQVDLYWSGLKAVLCSWGDANGLRTMKSLRLVNLHAEKGRETEDTMNEYVKEFIAKAGEEWQRPEGNKNLPEIHDIYSNASVTGGKQNLGPKTGASQNDNHPWFKEATDFAKQLRQMNPKTPKVKVAVIDDGVSPTYKSVGEYLHHSGWPHKGERAQENFTSTYGHGSKMAYLITRICPFAEIYVAKLNADTSDFRERSFGLRDATKALKWATSQGVDIISMSWNVCKVEKNRDDPGNEAEVIELEKAINTAATTNNILMYCAAGDQKGGISGSMKRVPCDSEHTISIGATDIHGAKKRYVIDNEKLRYLFPGENILQETDSDSKDVGNSGATALATGLAAMVLFFARDHNINIERKSVQEYISRVFDSVFGATSKDKAVKVQGILGKEKSKQERFKDKLRAQQ